MEPPIKLSSMFYLISLFHPSHTLDPIGPIIEVLVPEDYKSSNAQSLLLSFLCGKKARVVMVVNDAIKLTCPVDVYTLVNTTCAAL